MQASPGGAAACNRRTRALRLAIRLAPPRFRRPHSCEAGSPANPRSPLHRVRPEPGNVLSSFPSGDPAQSSVRRRCESWAHVAGLWDGNLAHAPCGGRAVRPVRVCPVGRAVAPSFGASDGLGPRSAGGIRPALVQHDGQTIRRAPLPDRALRDHREPAGATSPGTPPPAARVDRAAQTKSARANRAAASRCPRRRPWPRP